MGRWGIVNGTIPVNSVTFLLSCHIGSNYSAEMSKDCVIIVSLVLGIGSNMLHCVET
jgi:hypothetical protein